MTGPTVLRRPLLLFLLLAGFIATLLDVDWLAFAVLLAIIALWPWLTGAATPERQAPVSRFAAWRAEDAAVLSALEDRGIEGADEDDARCVIEALERARQNIEATP